VIRVDDEAVYNVESQNALIIGTTVLQMGTLIRAWERRGK
jgi:hypothetical protein